MNFLEGGKENGVKELIYDEYIDGVNNDLQSVEGESMVVRWCDDNTKDWRGHNIF